MKKEILDNELDQVVGGMVHLSGNTNTVEFTTLGETYKLKCPYKDARSELLSLFADNGEMSEAEFDAYVKKIFAAKGWI